jgi:predicted RNase H-like HicB family nuclease
MKDYHINVFYSEEDNCYVADIPDLQYCSAFGETAVEAVQEIEIAKSLWLEVAKEKGHDVPEPRYRPAIYAVLNTVNPKKAAVKKSLSVQKQSQRTPKKHVVKQLEVTI